MVLPNKDEKDSRPAPNKTGTYPPRTEPINIPINISVLRDMT